MNTTIALVDDHQMVLDGLSTLISAEFPDAALSTSTDPIAFLKSLEREPAIGLVISDLLMSGMNGLAFASAIRSRKPDLPILLISGVEDALPERILATSGANGFVSKKAGQKVLFEGIAAVLGGRFYLNGEILDVSRRVPVSVVRNGTSMPLHAEFRQPALSDRQIEVLSLIASGASNKDISLALQISENTVKSHIKLLFSTLGVNKRAACVRQAKMYGFI